MFLLKKKFKSIDILAIISAIFSGLWLFYSTPWGLGLSPDSISYQSNAKSILADASLINTASHWPPLYGLTLALTGLSADHILFAARVMHAVLIALNTLLIYCTTKACAGRYSVPLALSLLVWFQPSFVESHFYLWSEPLFISLLLLNVNLVFYNLDNPQKPRWLLTGIICSLALMTRYAGIFILIANALVILLATTEWRKRGQYWLSSFGPSVILMAAWSLYNRSRGSSTTNREFHFHPPTPQHWLELKLSLADWLHLPNQLGIGLFIVIITAFTYMLLEKKFSIKTKVIPLYCLVYFTFIFLSISFFDALTPLDGRILLPVFCLCLIFISSSLPQIAHQRLRIVAISVMAIALMINLPQAQRFSHNSHQQGLGFANNELQNLNIIQQLQQAPAAWRVSTNSPELFQLYLKQPAQMLPRWLDPVSNQHNINYPQQLAQLAQTSDVLVLFSAVAYRQYLSPANELNQLQGFTLVYHQADGAIWLNQQQAQHLQ